MRKWLSDRTAASVLRDFIGAPVAVRLAQTYRCAKNDVKLLDAERGYDAGNALQIGSELNSLEAVFGQQRAEGFGLPVADLEDESAAGDERPMRRRDETAIDGQAVIAGKECKFGLEIAHFNLEG